MGGIIMPDKTEDYYEILGLSKDATDKDIQRAFRKLAHKYHPDSNKTKEAEEKFKKINEAYNVLKDPEKRKAYDQFGHGWEQGQGYHSQDTSSWSGDEDILRSVFESIFRSNGFDSGQFGGFGRGFSKFGGGSSFYSRKSQQKGENTEAKINISIREAFFGGKKQVQLRVTDEQRGIMNKTLDIQIPKGITEGQKIRLRGQGQPGAFGGVKGDLLLSVHIVEEPNLEMKGLDIYGQLNLAPWEAVLGGKVKASTLEQTIELNIPPKTQNGRKFRIKGKGFSNSKGTGDFYFVTNIVIPQELSEEEEKLVREWSQISTFSPRG